MTPKLPNPENSSAAAGSPVRAAKAQAGDQLDQILLDDALLPSSGFAASIMDAIAAEASAPAPIPFPWKLALPILAAVVIAIAAAIRLVSQLRRNLAAHPNLAHLDLTWLTSHTIATQTISAVAAIGGALLCLLLTRYLATSRPTR